MRSIPILTLIVFLSTTVFCQVKYESYNLSQFKKNYDIEIKAKRNNPRAFTFYIYGESLDPSEEKVCLVIDQKGVGRFKEFLQQSRQNFLKWDSIANANNVGEMAKNMDVKKFACQGAFGIGNRYISPLQMIKSTASIINGKMRLLVRTGEALRSISNRFITHDGLVISFSNTEEIDDFLLKIDEHKAIEFITKANKTDALFD